MIRHPNFNGMQMDQITRNFTPARFIRTIDATYDGAAVFHLDSDISLSTDPVITFGFVPERKGTLKLVVSDSDKATFNHSFDVPAGLSSGRAMWRGRWLSARRGSCVRLLRLADVSGGSAGARAARLLDRVPHHGPVAATLAGATVIHTRKLAALLKRGDVLVVDVSDAPRRPENLAQQAPWLPLPHAAIPGAIWIPGAGAGAIAADLDQLLRARLALATGNDLSQRLVIYCHRNCWLSWNAAKRAISYGYRNVFWFPDGMEGWRAAGFATEVAQPLEAPPWQRPLVRDACGPISAGRTVAG